MVYECEHCHAALSPGMRFCGQCGQKFDEPVPDIPIASGTNISFIQGSALLKNRKNPLLIGFLGCGGLFLLLLIIGIVAGSSEHTTSPTQANVSASTHANAPQPVHVETDAERHAAALKAHEQATEKAKQAKAKAEEDRKEARQAREQAREEAREQKLAAMQEAREQAEASRQQRADDEVYARIKAKLAQDYPTSYITQKMLFDSNVEAYQYMKTVEDSSLKAKLEEDYPDSYITQKMLYDENIKAKQELGQ